jgi:hypothetical protein
MRTGTLLVALCAVALPGRAAAQSPRPIDLAERLSTEVTRLAGQGYHLRGLEVADDGPRLRIALVLAGPDDARQLSLTLADQGTRPVLYRHDVVAQPAEPRIYPIETELLSVLASGPLARLRSECGRWYVDGPGGSASAHPDEYHVVERTAEGVQAGVLLSTLLAAELEAGATLVSAGSAPDEELAIDFDLYGKQHRILRARLDGRFKVVGLEVRRAPMGWKPESYTRGDELAAALRDGGRVHAVAIDPDAVGGSRVIVRMRGSRFPIAAGDFYVESSECGC